MTKDELYAELTRLIKRYKPSHQEEFEWSTTPLVRVTISRDLWLRGEGATYSFLLRSADNKLCCLGQRCVAAGCSIAELRHRKAPCDLPEETLEKLPEWLKKNLIVWLMMSVNDNILIDVSNRNDDAEREQDLKTLALLVNEEWEFV